MAGGQGIVKKLCNVPVRGVRSLIARTNFQATQHIALPEGTEVRKGNKEAKTNPPSVIFVTPGSSSIGKDGQRAKGICKEKKLDFRSCKDACLPVIQ